MGWNTPSLSVVTARVCPMAKGRTISARELTSEDKKLLELCNTISKEYTKLVSGKDSQDSYWETWGKVNLSRDAGAGKGGAKVQRDALCTRGRSDKSPYSNRNLRWHPLVVSSSRPNFARAIEKIEISHKTGDKKLIFHIKTENETHAYSSEDSHQIPSVHAVLPEHWEPHHDELKTWSDEDWTRNSCLISANEACKPQDAIESFIALSASILVSSFKVKVERISEVTKKVLNESKQGSIYDDELSKLIQGDSLYVCPICRNSLSFGLEMFRKDARSPSWKPGWKENKQSEGNDHSPQVMHVNPLTEIEIRHTSKNVRYGHRWCNITMTDHSLDETLSFMRYVVERHN